MKIWEKFYFILFIMIVFGGCTVLLYLSGWFDSVIYKLFLIILFLIITVIMFISLWTNYLLYDYRRMKIGEIVYKADRFEKRRKQIKGNMTILATIGSTAPFIGLGGTVFGIIKSFHNIKNNTDPIWTGIYTAIIFVGSFIGIAIIAVMFFNYFNKRKELVEKL